ncbi:internal scaffolding protein [Microvirus mar29]|uniref:Internal scaffolding protein n=1 Tax=Microvirus mar29 TaxID=2851162 RepID=A0A8F5RCQ5_9VIRU|nr:internal scaffolding protein [Microvirus mar29]
MATKEKVIPFKQMSDFRNPFQARQRVMKEPGNSEHILYTSRIADDGSVELVPSGKEDIYAAIQSHKDSCDIHVLLARYANGDDTALSRVQGVYGDFTEMPKTYADLLNVVIRGEELFNSLPVETRAQFDHSLEKFIVSMDNMPEFLKKVGVKDDASGPKDSNVATGDDPASEVKPSVPEAR